MLLKFLLFGLILLTSPLSPFSYPFIMWPLIFILTILLLKKQIIEILALGPEKIEKEEVIKAQEHASSVAEHARHLLEKYMQQQT